MMTKSRPCRNTCLAASLLAGILWADAAFATVLTVPQEIQERDEWCWAATSQAILEYYGYPETQEEIAAYGTPGEPDIPNFIYGFYTDPPCSGPICNGVNRILKYFAGLTSTPYGSPLTEDDLRNRINSLRPVAIRWGWNSGGGHILVARGVAGDTVHLMDPWYGPTINSYGWVVRGSQYTWTDSLAMNTRPKVVRASIDKPASSSITATGATLAATIESYGAAVVTASGAACGKKANPGITGAMVKTSPAVNIGPFTVNVAGLASNTIYHFRGYATNQGGTAYTADSTFITVAGAPKATAAATINASGFTAKWMAPSGNAPIGYYQLYVATDKDFIYLIPGRPFNVSGTSQRIAASKGTYYYKVRAVNGGGTPGAFSGTIAVIIH